MTIVREESIVQAGYVVFYHIFKNVARMPILSAGISKLTSQYGEKISWIRK